jgi:hypothetical protein
MEPFAGESRSLSLFEGEGGGDVCFFHETFPGLGRGGGGLEGVLEDCFSKAAILSRSEPIFFGGGDSSAIFLSMLTEAANGWAKGERSPPSNLRQH